MSLLVAFSDKHTHYIAVDRAVSMQLNGDTYRVANHTMDKYVLLCDNTLIYPTGTPRLVEDLKTEYIKQYPSNTEELISIAKKIWGQHHKHDKSVEVQVTVYGFTGKGEATFLYFTSGNDFKPQVISGFERNTVSGQGSGFELAKQFLHTCNADNYYNKFKNIFEVPCSSESVGGEIDVLKLSANKGLVKHRIKLDEDLSILKLGYLTV